MPETFDEMKAVCEKLQAANITPFTAIYKDNWTVSQEFCSLFGGVLGGKDKIDSWLDSMNKGEGSFKVDGVDRVFDFMDLMKEIPDRIIWIRMRPQDFMHLQTRKQQ